MASYRLYNVQLLPIDTATTTDVGRIGYRRLFDALQKLTIHSRQERILTSIAAGLPHDTLFAPFTVDITDDFAYGSWVKYHEAESVQDLYTNASLFEAPSGTTPVSRIYLFQFLFDFVTHRLAIEESNGRLPGNASLLRVLDFVIRPLADQAFPKHQLVITLISSRTALAEALADAAGIKRVEAQVTFPNGHDMSELLQEMRDNNVHSLKTEAFAEKSGYMPRIPPRVMELVDAAIENGKAKFTYLSKRLKRQRVFSTAEHPLKLNLRRRKDESDQDYLARSFTALREVALDSSPPEIGDEE